MKTQYPQTGRGTANVLARNAAFTLADIMLLIVAIGMLLAFWLMITPRTPCLGARGRIQAAKTQVNNFRSALDMFNSDNGHYPIGTYGLDDLVRQPARATNWRQYMDSIPLDPWGRKYIYKCPGRHNPDSFDLMSMGPDGKAGTKDDITNW